MSEHQRQADLAHSDVISGGVGILYFTMDSGELQVKRLDPKDVYIAPDLKDFRTQCREQFEALVAMRNAINEYIPMPSLESDLLTGPEFSTNCETIAKAVIEYAQREAKPTEDHPCTTEHFSAVVLDTFGSAVMINSALRLWNDGRWLEAIALLPSEAQKRLLEDINGET